MANRDTTNNSERKYQCKFCPKRFTRSSVLNDHIRVHTGEKPFQCKICLKAFSQLTNLNRHNKTHSKDQISLAYPAVPSSSNTNSNQTENKKTSVQVSTKNLTSLSNLVDDDILALNQALSLNADDFQQQIQTSFEYGNISQNPQIRETFFHNSNDAILVSDESQESLSSGQEISPKYSEDLDVQPPRVELGLSTNTSVNSQKYFYDPSERNNSSFDFALRAPSDELEVIDIKPDLSVLAATNYINKLSPVNNTFNISNATLQLASSSQDDFADSQGGDYKDIFETEQVPVESIQYFKSESELCFDNNGLARAETATNDLIRGSASGLKSINNSLPNLSLPAISSSFHFVNPGAANSDRMHPNGHNESSGQMCSDFGPSNVILLSSPSSLRSTSQPNSPLPQVALNSMDKSSISYNFDDGSNKDVFIKSERGLEKSLEEESKPQSEFDAVGRIVLEDDSENPSIVIESVFSMNDKNKGGLSAGEELCENSELSSLVVKDSGISDPRKPRSEVEVINLEDFSPKEMKSDERHNWSVPLVDIQEITTQKLNAESNLGIQAAEIEDGTSANNKIWDISYLETDSRETLFGVTPSFQQTTNSAAENIPDFPNHVVSLEPFRFPCICCKKEFSDKSSLLSHICAGSEALHSLNSLYSPLAKDVDQIHLKAHGQSSDKAVANTLNSTKSHLSKTEKFTCKYCNKGFPQKCLLAKHTETHTNKRPSACNLCRRPFSEMTNLKNQERKPNLRNGMLHCQFCEKTFPRSFELLNHLKYHARSIQKIQTSIKALEDEIRQKQKKRIMLKKAGTVSNKSLKLRVSPNPKYLKMKPKSMQLSEENVNPSNNRNFSIPVLHLKRSHSADPQFNAIPPKNDENLNPQDLCNTGMKKRPIGHKCLEVEGNLTRNTSSDFSVENISAGECISMSKTRQEAEEDVNQIEFSFSVKASEEQSKVNTDSGTCEQLKSENTSSHILKNFKSEEADKSLPIVGVQIQPPELFSHIENRENHPQKDILPIPTSFLSNAHSRDHTTNPYDKLLQTDLSSMQSGFGLVDVTTTAVNPQNTPVDENLSEVIFVTSNCAEDTPDQSSPSNTPVKSGGQFHCKVCKKSFNQKFIFIKHLRTHTEEKPFKCEFCPRSFSQSSNLSRHRKSHLLFPCKFCPTKHPSLSELEAHHQNMHMSMKSYTCKFCNKTFTRSSVLKEHIRTHTGEKPYVCEVCNRAFTQATNLNRHMKVHVPGRVFRCRYCSYTFKQYWHFKRHLKTHLGKISNEEAFIRKPPKRNSSQQIPRRFTPSKSNDLICKLSESNEQKLRRRIQPFQEKTENLESKQGSLHVGGTYETDTYPGPLEDNSYQHCPNLQPYEETLPNITGTPEILAINSHLLPNNRPLLQLEMQSSGPTPIGLVPNFCHESFQQNPNHVSSDDFLHNNIPSNHPFLLTTGQNQTTSSSFDLMNNSESFTKQEVFGQVNVERNNDNAFVNPDCKSLREADDANADNQSKNNSRSDMESAINYQRNGVGILWKATHENDYETIRQSLQEEDAITLVSPVDSSSVNVKLEPEDLHMEKQLEPTPETSNSYYLHRSPSVVPLEFRCTYCNKLFHHRQVLRRHLRSQHKSEMMTTSTCQLCHTSFPDSDTLNSHRKTCPQLLLPYFCNLCKEKFPNSSELSRHRQRKHCGGVKRYPCRYCTKVFTRNSVLTEHIRTHTGEKPYICDLCQRPFSQATNLKRHQKIHARNGLFECKYCKASFGKVSFLSRHLRLHAEERKRQDSATAGCQLGNQAAVPLLKETEKFDKAFKIGENPKNRPMRMKSKTMTFATKDSAVVHIASLSNLSQQQEGCLQNDEIGNITSEVVLEVSKSRTNSEPVTMQEQLQNTIVTSDMRRSNFSQTLQLEQIDNLMEGPGLCYSSLRRNVGEKPRQTPKDHLPLNVAARMQGAVTASVPIISPETHFSDAVSPNFFEQQKGKNCLELSSQPVIDIDLSIVKKEENLCSPRSSDQQHFLSYDSSNVLGQQTISSITQNPVTPNIEIPKFTPDFITPSRRGQESAINKPYRSPVGSLAFATQGQRNNRISTQSETVTKTPTNRANLLYSCKFCKLRFSTSRQLFHHQKLKHPLMKSHQCKYCGRFFARTTVLTEHIRTHTGEKPYVCNVCYRAFSQMTNLKRHQKIHDRRCITCRYCTEVFTDYALLLKHIQSHGKSLDTIPKNFKSNGPASSDVYARISERVQSMVPKSGRVNSPRGTRHAKFPLARNESRLSIHEPSCIIDQEDERIFTPGTSALSAPLSNLDSGSSSNYFPLQNLQEDQRQNLNLASHPNETMLSQISTWPWKTNLPSKIKSIPKSVTSRFREQNIWSNPVDSGSGEQQVMKPKGGQREEIDLCTIPETSVSQLSQLAEFSSDLLQSGSSDDTQKYSCRYCKKIFLQLSDLNSHSPCQDREKCYRCKYCSQAFSRSCVLKQHIRIHTGEKPFKCDHCLRCFTQSSNLMRHMKLHNTDNQISKNFDSRKKSHFRAFSHSLHKQLGYYGKSTFRKYNSNSNKKSIPLKQMEQNAQNHYEGESGQKHIFPPFSNLTYPSTTSQLPIIASHSHHNSLQTASEESILLNSGNTTYDTTVIAPELNSLKQNSDTDNSLTVLSSSKGKKTDTIYLQMNEENETNVPLQPESLTRTTDTNFIPAVETSNNSTKVSFSARAEIAANKEPVPSNHYGSNYNHSIKSSRREASSTPRIEASSTPRIEHTKPAKKIYVCMVCKEVFTTRWKLSTHLKSHSTRLFQCTFCEKGFTRSSVLKEHIRTHTGEKPYKCTHCQRSFSQMTNLKRHLKVHNRQPQTAMSDSVTI